MKNYKKAFAYLIATPLFVFQLTGCAKHVKPGNYDATEVGGTNRVVPGTIMSMRPVNIRNRADSDGSGAANGDKDLVRSHGVEYVVKLSSGAMISLVQTDESALKIKQHVLIIYGDTTRIVADEGGDEY